MAIEYHLPRLFRIAGVESCQVFDSDERRRAILARRFRGNRRIDVVAQIPGNTDYDLVVIATPPKFHFAYFQELKHRAHAFLIEKPVTISAADAAAMADHADSSGVPIFVNLIRRTLCSYQLVRRMVDEGQYGRLRRVAISEGGIFGWRGASFASFSSELNGGGVLMDTGPHVLDLVFQVFDDVELEAAVVDARAPAVEANCTLHMRANQETPVVVALSRNRYLSNSAEFEFDDAVVSVGVRSNQMHVTWRSGCEHELSPAGVEIVSPNFEELNDAFYRDFIAAGNASTVGPRESLKAMRLIENAYAKASLSTENLW